VFACLPRWSAHLWPPKPLSIYSPSSSWASSHGAPRAAPLAAPARCSLTHQCLATPHGAPRTPPSGRARSRIPSRVQSPRCGKDPVCRICPCGRIAQCGNRRRFRMSRGPSTRPPPSAAPAGHQPPHMRDSPPPPAGDAPSRPRGRARHSQHSPAGSRPRRWMAQAPCPGNTLPERGWAAPWSRRRPPSRPSGCAPSAAPPAPRGRARSGRQCQCACTG